MRGREGDREVEEEEEEEEKEEGLAVRCPLRWSLLPASISLGMARTPPSRQYFGQDARLPAIRSGHTRLPGPSSLHQDLALKRARIRFHVPPPEIIWSTPHPPLHRLPSS